MKKLLAKVLFIYSIIFIVSSVYAAEGKVTNKLSAPKFTFEDGRNELSCIRYDVTIEGEKIGKTINIHQYIPSVGEYIELREFVEALGGTITWEKPNSESYDLGYFELLGSKYKYKSHFSQVELGYLEDDTKINDYAAINYPINIYMCNNDNDSYIHIPMGNQVENINGKFVNNHIYIQMDKLRGVLSRVGYLYNIDDETKTFNVKKYDFNVEKELMLKKFPKEKFGNGLYGQMNGEEFENIVYYPTIDEETGKYKEEASFSDYFVNQNNWTNLMESNYIQYFDIYYQKLHTVHNDIEKYYKNLLQSTYLYYYDNIILSYDSDLDAYIVSNKDFSGVEKIDETYAILVVRKFDNMILYRSFR